MHLDDKHKHPQYYSAAVIMTQRVERIRVGTVSINQTQQTPERMRLSTTSTPADCPINASLFLQSFSSLVSRSQVAHEGHREPACEHGYGAPPASSHLKDRSSCLASTSSTFGQDSIVHHGVRYHSRGTSLKQTKFHSLISSRRQHNIIQGPAHKANIIAALISIADLPSARYHCSGSNFFQLLLLLIC